MVLIKQILLKVDQSKVLSGKLGCEDEARRGSSMLTGATFELVRMSGEGSLQTRHLGLSGSAVEYSRDRRVSGTIPDYGHLMSNCAWA